MTQKQDKSHQVSLKRPDGWYSADNEMVTVFAPLIGPYAFSVYHLLKQRSFLAVEERGISHLGLSEALTMSKDSVGNALETLKHFYLLEELPPLAMNKPPRYEVVHAKDALAAHPEIRTWLVVSRCKNAEPGILKSGRGKKTREIPQFPQSHPEIRTRVRTKRVLKSGRPASVIQDGGGRNSGRSHPEIRTPNKEEVLKEKVQEQDTTALPPEGGGSEPGGESGPQPTKRIALDELTPVRDTLVGMLRDLKADKPMPAEEINPRQRAGFFLEYLHDMFASTPTAPGFAAARGDNWEDPYAAWMRCFDHVRVGDVEADGTQMVVLLETPKPKDLVAGLNKYRAKVQLAMKKAFGREVQLVPRLEAA